MGGTHRRSLGRTVWIELLGRHIGQRELGQWMARLQQTLESAEDDGPTTATTFDELRVDALRVKLADRESHHVAKSIDLERDDGFRQLVELPSPLVWPERLR